MLCLLTVDLLSSIHPNWKRCCPRKSSQTNRVRRTRLFDYPSWIPQVMGPFSGHKKPLIYIYIGQSMDASAGVHRLAPAQHTFPSAPHSTLAERGLCGELLGCGDLFWASVHRLGLLHGRWGQCLDGLCPVKQYEIISARW